MNASRLRQFLCESTWTRWVAVVYMASSRLPNNLFYGEQVLDCIYTFGLSVARVCPAPMDFARRLLLISTASRALRLRRFCHRRSDLLAIESDYLCNQ
jgi:hypothetical protein